MPERKALHGRPGRLVAWRAMKRSPRLPVLFALASSLLGCGAPLPPGQVPNEGLAPTSAASAAPATAPGSAPGHALLLQASACWFGGMWSDAEGAAPDERRAGAEKRCQALVARLYGADDRARLDEVRLVSAPVVDRLAAEIDRLAGQDGVDGHRKEALGKVLRAVAAAQRETNEAHVAADTVKQDLKSHEEREALSRDETLAVKPLRAHAGLEALLRLDAGELTAEAHVMGLMCAMDRMELARALPKHLKVYAVGDAYQLVFGVAPPSVPEDAMAKLKPGLWLAYLTDVARAAGHAVPDKATIPREREPWAWGGVLAGFSDKLKADVAKLAAGGVISRVTRAITARLDVEWAEIPSVAASQRTMEEREEKARKR